MITTIDLSEDLMRELDAMVAERRLQRLQPQTPFRMNEKQRHEAHRIANEKGAAFANEYIKSLQPLKPKIKASRGSILAELAMEALAARKLNPPKVEPQPVPASQRRPAPHKPKLKN